MNISIRHLEHFIAVAQELHFRRAAELANVAQPALSRSVQTLESELGLQLLARNNRNVRLTAAGKEFLAGCTDIIDAMQTTIEKSKRARQTELGGLNVGYTYIAMNGKLPDLLIQFEAQHPDIPIELTGISSADQLERLHHNELDFCFITGSIGEEEANTSLFQTDRFIVIANDHHRFANKTSISLEELCREKILLRTDAKAASFNQHVYDFFRQANLTPNIESFDLDHIGLLGKVAMDKGVCIATEGYSGVYAERLTALKLTGVEAKLPTIMVWPKDVVSDSVTTFRQFMLDHIELDRPTVLSQAAIKVPNKAPETA